MYFESSRSLEEVGIRVLTGEACGLGMRILCDLDQDGIKLWETFTRSKVIANPWNDGKASVMIPSSMFRDLWIFGHVMKGTKNVFVGGYVWSEQWEEYTYTLAKEDGGEEVVSHRVPKKEWNSSAYAIDDDDEMKRIHDAVEAGHFYIVRNYAKSSHPGTGLDNYHMMSGRIT